MITRFHILLFSIALLPVTGCATAGSDEPDTSPPPRLFAAMAMTGDQQASSVPTDSGLMILDAESQEWERLGPQIMFINSAVADPDDPDRLYYACGNGIARTTDAGKTWRLVTGWRESDITRIVIDPTDSDRIYAASIWGVTISKDRGETWEAANTGLPEYFSKDIIIDEADPRRLFLATTTGLFISTDRAVNWERVHSFPEIALLRMERSLADPDVWIAGTEGRGVWMSRDNAKTWKQVAPALASANVYAVALDPADPSRMAAGGWGTGAYLSEDGGSTWQRITAPLPSPNITALIFEPRNGGRLWASTFEKGSFHTNDSGENWSDPFLVGAYVFDLGFL